MAQICDICGEKIMVYAEMPPMQTTMIGKDGTAYNFGVKTAVGVGQSCNYDTMPLSFCLFCRMTALAQAVNETMSKVRLKGVDSVIPNKGRT